MKDRGWWGGPFKIDKKLKDEFIVVTLQKGIWGPLGSSRLRTLVGEDTL